MQTNMGIIPVMRVEARLSSGYEYPTQASGLTGWPELKLFHLMTQRELLGLTLKGMVLSFDSASTFQIAKWAKQCMHD